MALSFEQALERIEQTAAAQADLVAADTQSRTGVWGDMKNVVAQLAVFLSQKLEEHKADVRLQAEKSLSGPVIWYGERIREFQYKPPTVYNLIVVPSAGTRYEVIDPTARIVAAVSVVESGNGTLDIKVAKADTGGNLVKLTTDEVSALRGYLERIKFAGTAINLNSYDPDLLTVNLTIGYDPFYPLATLKTEVELAINSYLKALPFNGWFQPITLIDYVQKVLGVEYVRNTGIAIGALPVVDRIRFNAGYAKIDPATPLSSTLTYTPTA